MRLYASMFKEEVAGIVLVDASHEDVDRTIPRGQPAVRLPQSLRPAFEVWMAFAWRTGLLRISSRDPLGDVKRPATIRASEWSTIKQLAAQPKALKASATESFDLSARQARAAGTLGDLPLIVLTAGRLARDDPEARDDHRAWLQLQSELTHLSTNSRLVVVARSGHLMPFDAPEEIVSATHELVAAVRAGRVRQPR